MERECGLGWGGGLLGGQRWLWPHVRDMWQRLFFRFHRVSVLPAEWTLADRTRDDAREVRARFLMQGWIKSLCSYFISLPLPICLSLYSSLSLSLFPFLIISLALFLNIVSHLYFALTSKKIVSWFDPAEMSLVWKWIAVSCIICDSSGLHVRHLAMRQWTVDLRKAKKNSGEAGKKQDLCSTVESLIWTDELLHWRDALVHVKTSFHFSLYDE